MSAIDSAAAGIVFAASAGPLAVASIRSLARFRAQQRVIDREIRSLAAPMRPVRGRSRRAVEGGR